MAFDLASAKPVEEQSSPSFDLDSAKPVKETRDNEDQVSRSVPFRKNEFAKELFRATEPPGVRYMADAGFGVKQAWDALAQMLARGTEKATAGTAIGPTVGASRTDMESTMREDLARYKTNFSPEERPGSDLARGFGQSQVLGPLMPAARGVMGITAVGAGAGAGAGVLEPIYEPTDDFWKQKGKQATTGAVIGGGVGAGGSLLAKAISPALGAGQKLLSDMGINLTPGQALGGVFKSIEDKMTSWPILGDIIQSARNRGIMDFNRAVYTRATESFGADGLAVAKRAKVGREGVAEVGDYLSSRYEHALLNSNPAPYDGTIDAALAKIESMVPAARKQDFIDLMKREVYDKFTPANTITPHVAKQADSTLGHWASEYKGSSLADDRIYSAAIREAQSQMRQLFARNNPQTADLIRAADQGWATLAQMERAAGSVGAKEGVFTPAQAFRAMKAGDKSVRDRATARGEMNNEDLYDAAKSVLPSGVNDSGTTGRLLLAGMSGGAHLFDPTGISATLHGIAALPYLPGIGPIINKLMFSRPQGAETLRDLATQMVPATAAGAAATYGP